MKTIRETADVGDIIKAHKLDLKLLHFGTYLSKIAKNLLKFNQFQYFEIGLIIDRLKPKINNNK
jgi:hypothetical protein